MAWEASRLGATASRKVLFQAQLCTAVHGAALLHLSPGVELPNPPFPLSSGTPAQVWCSACPVTPVLR